MIEMRLWKIPAFSHSQFHTEKLSKVPPHFDIYSLQHYSNERIPYSNILNWNYANCGRTEMLHQIYFFSNLGRCKVIQIQEYKVFLCLSVFLLTRVVEFLKSFPDFVWVHNLKSSSTIKKKSWSQKKICYSNIHELQSVTWVTFLNNKHDKLLKYNFIWFS